MTISKSPQEVEVWVKKFQVKPTIFNYLVPTLNITQAEIIEDGVILGNRFFTAKGNYQKDSDEIKMTIRSRKRFKVAAGVLLAFGTFLLYGILFSEITSTGEVNMLNSFENLGFAAIFSVTYGFPFLLFYGFKKDFKNKIVKSAQP